MPRLLKMTALLAGLILATTLVLQALRPLDPDMRVPLVVDSHLIQLWPGVQRPFIVTPGLVDELNWAGVSDDATTVYYSVAGPIRSQTEFYWVSAPDMTPHRVPIATPPNYPEASYAPVACDATCDWVLYAVSDPALSWRYWLVHMPTQRQIDLNALVAPYQATSQSQLLIEEGRWLHLLVNNPAQNRLDMLRVDLRDGTWHNITANYSTEGYVAVGAQLIGGWLLIELGNRAYRLHPDGSVFETLIADDWHDPNAREVFVRADVRLGMAFVQRGNQTLGVEVASQQVLWQMDNLRPYWTTDEGASWVIALKDNTTWIALHLSTGETKHFPYPMNRTDYTPVVQTPDGEWLICIYRNPTGTEEWRMIHWDTLATRTILRSSHYFADADYSPDGQWLWLRAADGLYRLHMADGHVEKMSDYPYTIIGWMRPMLREWHPLPLLLIALALMLIGILPCHRLKSLLHRLSTSGGH